jgi:predicted DNA binding protein
MGLMWLLKLSLQHNCIIGNRCKQFHCTSAGYALDSFKEAGYMHYLHFEKIEGKNAAAFLQDLKQDSHVVHFEANNNTAFFIYKTKETGTMPAQMSLSAKKVFHVKPIFVDKEGIEHWEVATWNREDINSFISYLKKSTHNLVSFKIDKIVKTTLNDIFFPTVMPSLTAHQKKALDIAITEGYYDYPRHSELEMLSKIMGVSLSTYREHLRKAEKVMLRNVR